jgi:diacylglycerol O-acyltransferase
MVIVILGVGFSLSFPIILLLLAYLVYGRLTDNTLLSLESSMLLSGDPKYLANISGIMAFKEPLPYEKVYQMMAEKIGKLREFTSVIHRPYYFGWPRYVHTDFKVENHISRKILGGSGSQKDLEEYIAAIAGKPLNPAKPLWECYIIDGYKKDGGPETSVLYIRFHHCIADGGSSLQMLLYILSVSEKTKDDLAHIVKKRRIEPLKRDPFEILHDYYKSVNHLMFPVKDTKTVLTVDARESSLDNVKVIFGKNLFKVDALKQVAHKYNNSSVNDVILSSLSGAINKYVHNYSSSELLNDFVLNPTLKTGMWINMRPPTWFDSKPEGIPILENQMASVMFPLPLDENPETRLIKVNEYTRSLLSTVEPIVSQTLFRLFGLFPPVITEQIGRFLLRSISLSVSNVPGPQYPLELCGIEMDTLSFFVNPTWSLGTMISIISYNGNVSATICCWDEKIPHPLDILAYLKEDFESLQKGSGIRKDE